MAPPTFSQQISDFLLHLVEQHLAKIVTFGVTKGDESTDPPSLITLAPLGIDASLSSSYLVQEELKLTLPHGQTLQFPLSQSYSIAHDSFMRKRTNITMVFSTITEERHVNPVLIMHILR